VQEAETIGHPVPVVAPSVPITLKIPANIVGEVRAYSVIKPGDQSTFCVQGVTTAPCGVPLSRSTKFPSGILTGARSHRQGRAEPVGGRCAAAPLSSRGPNRYVNPTHGWRKVASGRHPIPDPVEILTQISGELLDRLSVNSNRPSVGLHLLIRFPHFAFGNTTAFLYP
jgi:hypothetical protein